MKKRNNRDQMVIATKYTSPFRASHRDTEILANTVGNGTKSLHVSVNASLKKLQTDYIDLVSLCLAEWQLKCLTADSYGCTG
jgi:aryl-alcohol dehydrogenase-like predicted oxidoreductase